MGKAVVVFLSCFFLLFLIQSSTYHDTKADRFPVSRQSSLADSLATDFSDYVWPTDAGRLVTSVFAEFRTTHFHGGIDISTGDDTGFKVFASRDGYVSRIVVGPTGYGNMLWVRHADGYYTTYAHLRNFNAAIDKRVADEQMRLEQFPVDIDCAPSDFPVKRGELIAFTGETGTGSPHLHFEIRDESKDFVNPLLCSDFTFFDNIPPLIYRMAATPLDEFSTVNGSYSSRAIEFNAPVQGSFAIPETIYASGSFGFAVDARDRINGSRFRNGVYRYHLFLNDSLIYSVQLDRAPSGEDFQVGLHYDFALMAEEGGRFARLYMNSPNSLSIYQPRKENAGVIATNRHKRGIHKFRIVASDFSQNTSEVTGTIVFSDPPALRASASNGFVRFEFDPAQPPVHIRAFTSFLPGRGRNAARWKEERIPVNQPILDLSGIRGRYDVLKLEGRDPFGARTPPLFFTSHDRNLPGGAMGLEYEVLSDFVRVGLHTDGIFTSAPSVALVEGTSSRLLNVTPVDFNHYTAAFRPLASIAGKRTVFAEAELNGRLNTASRDITVYPILPKKGTRLSLDNGNLVVQADPSSVYKPLYLTMEKYSERDGPSYSLLPRHNVLNGGITVMVRGDTLNRHQGLFFRRRGSWTFLSRNRQGVFFVGTLRRTLGDIALLSDTMPPTISRLIVPSRYSKQPHIISFSVRDNLSGVEYDELKLYIDGRFAIPEIDGEHRRVEHRFAEPLKRGPHSLLILVRDRMGNTNEVRRTFTIR